MFFLVRQEPDAKILRYVILSVGGLDDFLVLSAGRLFGRDHGFDHADNVGGVGGGLLLSAEVQRIGTRHRAAQLLDPLSQLLGMKNLGIDVDGKRLLDLFGANAVKVDAAGNVEYAKRLVTYRGKRSTVATLPEKR